MPIGSVEVNAPYGGDIAVASNGDLALISDQVGTPAATALRVTRLLMTCPQLEDENGNVVAPADDLFNPTWGVGLPRIVSQGITPALEADIKAAINSGLAGFPDVAQSPAPVITVEPAQSSSSGAPLNGELIVSLVCATVDGEIVTLPALPVPQSFGSL